MKTLAKLIAVLVLIVVVVIVGAFYYIDAIAKKAIEQGGEMALGVPTTLEDMHISLFGGEAELAGLEIANPTGYSGSFMGLGQGGVAVSLGSLMDDTIRVPHVRLSGIRVNLFQKGKENNIEPLLARTRALAGNKGSQAKQSTADGGKKLIVELFSLDDVQVNANLELLGQTSKINLTLPRIELRNLGAEQGGLPMAELVQQVVQAVLSAVQSSSMQLSPALAQLLAGELGGLDGIKTEVIGQAKAEVEKQVREVQKQVSETIKQVVPESPMTEEVNKMVEEKSGDLLKGVGDLLGGGKK